MKKIYAIANLIITVGIIIWNYATNVIGINGNTVGSLSSEYENLFTPASYAFAIWGLIFISLMAFSIFQVISAFSKDKEDDFILQIGPWYSIANLANAAWLWFWLNEVTWFTVILMLLILFSLIQVIIRLDMNRAVVAKQIKAFVWFPMGLYAGWITVATVANFSAYFAKINFDFLFSETVWAIILIIIAAIINYLVLIKRNIPVFAGVGVWALIAISVRYWGTNPSVQWVALAAAVGLTIAILINVFGKNK